MATGETQTYTVDTQVQTETMPDNLTPEEQDSLKIGEEISQQEDQLLAGKYKSAAELEKAYKELESKLGQSQPETETPEAEAETPEAEPESESEPTDLSDNASLITSASDEYYSNDGKLSPETISKFKCMSSEDLVNAYLEVTKSPDWSAKPPEQVDEISDLQIDEVKNAVGGDQQYKQMIQWAGKNLDQEAAKDYDEVLATGNKSAVKFAVKALMGQYEDANGRDSKLVTGKESAPETYRSMAEVVRDMNKPEYETDDAYRDDVRRKLEMSNLKV